MTFILPDVLIKLNGKKYYEPHLASQRSAAPDDDDDHQQALASVINQIEANTNAVKKDTSIIPKGTAKCLGDQKPRDVSYHHLSISSDMF